MIRLSPRLPRFRRAALAAPLFAAILLAAGCNRAEKRRLEERRILWKLEGDQAARARRPLRTGQPVVFPFPADNFWHPSPHRAEIGWKLRVEGDGVHKETAAGGVEFTIGGRGVMVISGTTDFVVSEPGPIAFRTRPRERRRFGETVEVRITRIR